MGTGIGDWGLAREGLGTGVAAALFSIRSPPPPPPPFVVRSATGCPHSASR